MFPVCPKCKRKLDAGTAQAICPGCGLVLMLAANAWGALLLLRQFRNRTDRPVREMGE